MNDENENLGDELEYQETSPAGEANDEYLQSRARHLRAILDEAASRHGADKADGNPEPLPSPPKLPSTPQFPALPPLPTSSSPTQLKPATTVRRFYLHTVWPRARNERWGYNKGPFTSDEVRELINRKEIAWSDMISEDFVDQKKTYEAVWHPLFENELFAPFSQLQAVVSGRNHRKYENIFWEKVWGDLVTWSTLYIGNSEIVTKLATLIAVSKATATLPPNILIYGNVDRYAKSMLIEALSWDLTEANTLWTSAQAYPETEIAAADIIVFHDIDRKGDAFVPDHMTLIASATSPDGLGISFPIRYCLEPYTVEDIFQILKLEYPNISEEVLRVISASAEDNPEKGRELLRWSLHYTAYKGISSPTVNLASEALSLTR